MAAEPALDSRSHLRFASLAVVSFAGSFCLLVVQPMLAKWLLPALGGSPATWVTCMLFFQSLLVLGYGAAHVAARSPKLRIAYAAFALAAIGCTIWNRELTSSSAAAFSGEALEHGLALHVLGLLFSRAGLPYLMLATGAPLVQRWAVQFPERSVVRLYAVSNAGSLAALLAYPTLIEPSLPLAATWRGWSVATALVCAALLGLALRLPPAPEPLPDADGGETPKAGAGDLRHAIGARLLWAGYAFVPSVLLLATTTYLTTDIAAVPLLWVVPLALYFATFIVAFGGAGERTRRLALTAFVLASVGSGWNAFSQGSASLSRQLVLSLATLMSGALACHLELVRARPAPSRLTEYYVWIALGGALGGIFVGLVAPLCFDDYYELELAVLATYALLLARREPNTDVADDLAGMRMRRSGRRALTWLGLCVCLPVLGGSVWLRAHGGGSREGRVLTRQRSFLGALRVTQLDVGRILTHGRIRHGMQLAAPAWRRAPTMYYGPGTAIAQVFARQRAGEARMIGVVGLGAGTLAALGQPRDHMRFYELDAQVVDVARRWFTFLEDSPARIDTWIGDGRIGLGLEPSGRFDLLVLDAFASDAVPVHLLTREAFRLYARVLSRDGVLLLNVSNRHLAVDRVARGAARSAGLACVVVETPADADHFVSKVRWAIVARRHDHLSSLVDGMNPADDPFPEVVWTDDHASLWPVLR